MEGTNSELCEERRLLWEELQRNGGRGVEIAERIDAIDAWLERPAESSEEEA